MKCRECESQGLVSEIDVGGAGVSTAMAVRYFYDTEGRYHAHDSNSFTTTFRCSNGHRWSETLVEKCWCEEVGGL